MLNAPQLEELKQEMRRLVTEGIGEALRALQERLPSHCPKQDAILALQSRLNDANRQKIQGVLSQEQLQLTYNQIRADLLALIRDFTVEDFAPALPPEKLQDKKTGQILYKIPDHMQVEQESKCIIRLAFAVDEIIRNIEITDEVTLKTVRISEVMNVALVDPNPEAAFLIRSFSSEEQFVERGDYTEWVFYVTPLREGVFPLLLKVSVVEIVQGKERRKDIVLEETVQITAAAPEEVSTGFRPADYQLNVAGAETPPSFEPEDFAPITPSRSVEPTPLPPLSPSPETQAPPRSRLRSLRRTLSVAAGFLVILTVSVFLVQQQFNKTLHPTDIERPEPEPVDSLEDPFILPDSLSTTAPEDSIR